jgi:hypothetical protein
MFASEPVMPPRLPVKPGAVDEPGRPRRGRIRLQAFGSPRLSAPMIKPTRAMMWFIFQSVVICAAMTTNSPWHWTSVASLKYR